MTDYILLTNLETGIFLIAILLLAVQYHSFGYDIKKIIFWCIILMPFIYFSVNMVTEIVTADEAKYELRFTNVKNIKNLDLPLKLIYEYKFSQFTLGTLFLMIPDQIKNIMSRAAVWKVYKTAHYFIFYGLSLLVMRVWHYWIFDENGIRRRIGENGILITLIGLPLSCLLIKVVNYDAGSTYPAVLGVSLIWAAYRSEDERKAVIGTICTAVGVMDKWTALPYWCICVILYSYMAIRRKEKWKDKIIYTACTVSISYIAALLLSYFYLLYASIQQDGLCTDINWGNVTFSFEHTVRAIITGNINIDYINADAYSGDAVWYIFILFGLLIACTLFLELVMSLWKKHRISVNMVLGYFQKSCLVFGIIGGVICAYVFSCHISPYLAIEPGYYISADGLDGWTYHYGARTFIGHFIAKLCYMCATVICNYPSAVLCMLALSAGLALKHGQDDRMTVCNLVYTSGIALLALYVMAGLPSDARYYSYPILIIVLSSIYTCYLYYHGTKMKNIFALSLTILWILEMLLYVPNIKAFSPIWVMRDRSFNESVRKGEWYAGEVMFWGENVALAGRKIKNIVDLNDDISYSDVTIYNDYGNIWIENPGFSFKELGDYDGSGLDEKTFIVLNKFALFRKDVPPFLESVDPMDTISYKGEIGAWIYRGDQLKEYEEYFFQEQRNRE